LNIKDPGSYTLLQGWYSKDKFFVYYKGDIVVNADPGSIDFITGSVWVRDNKSYFYEGKQVNFVDYNSFQYLDYNYAKDKNNVYYNNEIIEGTDAASFVHIEYTQEGKDKNNCYFNGKKLDCSQLSN